MVTGNSGKSSGGEKHRADSGCFHTLPDVFYGFSQFIAIQTSDVSGVSEEIIFFISKDEGLITGKMTVVIQHKYHFVVL